MLHFSTFEKSFNDKLEIVKSRKQELFYNEIFTFDIETTSCYFINGKLHEFDFSKPKSYYDDKEKIAFMYIWQFGINDVVFYGRTWKEFITFMCIFNEKYPNKKIVYVHNLSYEFQFLLNVLDNEDVIKQFSRKPHKVMKFDFDRFNCIFKCSYILSGMSLEKIAENYKLPVKKLVGNLDYNKIRYSTTFLNDYEMQYCENDLLVMYHYLLRHKEKYKYIHDIPLTQTGEVRRVVKNLYKNDTNYYKKIWQMQPKDFRELKLLIDVFMGGYTHANSVHVNDKISNVFSKDLSSSYPTVMVCKKFPVSSFFPIREIDIEKIESDFDNNAYIFEVEYENIESTNFNHYISVSKTFNRKNIIEDNGRVVRAEKLSIKITELDYQIIEKVYKYKKRNFIKIYKAKKDYLPKKFVEYILELFGNKTKLKDNDEWESLYMQSKQYINALYGMCVTNVITDEVLFENFEWIKKELTEKTANEIIRKNSKSRNTFLNFAWGVWVTAYARFNIWKAIIELDYDLIYTDTDSVKYINDHEKFFNKYNEDLINEMSVALTQQGIDTSLLTPKDSKGKTHYLGIFDTEKKSDFFLTMGAKKYISQIGNDLKITVSGVNKKAVKQLKSFDDFKVGFEFDYKNSGRLIMTYINNMPTIHTIDEHGNEIIIEDRFCIHAMPTTYTLGISETFDDYLTAEHNKESVYSEIFR